MYVYINTYMYVYMHTHCRGEICAGGKDNKMRCWTETSGYIIRSNYARSMALCASALKASEVLL